MKCLIFVAILAQAFPLVKTTYWISFALAVVCIMVSSAAPVSSRPCRILCYGDSLTAGFHAGGKQFSPYGAVLQDSLRSLGVQAEISICGISGHRSDQFLAEINAPVTARDITGKSGKGLAYMLDKEGPYDLVILMAGTNDFAPNISLRSISDMVCKLHAACHGASFFTC